MRTYTRRIKNIERTCVSCGKPFLTSIHLIENRPNGGTCCSYACVGARKHELYSQDGPENPNYKGHLKQSKYEYKLNFRAKYPEKALAHDIVASERRKGNIIPKPCEICASIEVEAHHKDYNKPLEITWLCKKHHIEAHL